MTLRRVRQLPPAPQVHVSVELTTNSQEQANREELSLQLARSSADSVSAISQPARSAASSIYASSQPARSSPEPVEVPPEESSWGLRERPVVQDNPAGADRLLLLCTTPYGTRYHKPTCTQIDESRVVRWHSRCLRCTDVVLEVEFFQGEGMFWFGDGIFHVAHCLHATRVVRFLPCAHFSYRFANRAVVPYVDLPERGMDLAH